MKRPAFYAPLAISLIFGFIVGSISISPVFGDTACQGATASTAKVVMAGRVITPSTILRGAPCLPGETAINVLNLTRTVIVSPNGTPSQNGATLLSAMQTISNANPSAANPWLLKLEPGNYDLGNQSLMLVPFMDLEGSGEGTTTISSTAGNTTGQTYNTLLNGTVVMSTSNEVRFVKIANSGSNNYQTAVSLPVIAEDARINHVTIYITGGKNNYGINNFSLKPVTVTNSTLTASGVFTNMALLSYWPNPLLTVSDSVLTASDGAVNNVAMAVLGDSNSNFFPQAIIQNSILTASGGGAGTGLIATHAVISVTGSTLTASSLGGTNIDTYGIENAYGTLTVQGSKITVSGGDINWGLLGVSGVQNLYDTGIYSSGGSKSYGLYQYQESLKPIPASAVHNSVLSASGASTDNYPLANGNGVSKIGASQLASPAGIVVGAGGTVVCVASYDINFAPLNSNCTTGP